MLELTKLNKAIKAIATRSSTQKAEIHEALIGCAFFAQRDRNMDPAIRLFKAVGNETNRRAMSHWLSSFAPIHFKDESPLLSDKRQKEYSGTMEEFEADLRSAPHFTDFNVEGNTARNVWDTAAKLQNFDEYFLKVIAQMRKHDLAIAQALDTAHNLTRAELSKVVVVSEK